MAKVYGGGGPAPRPKSLWGKGLWILDIHVFGIGGNVPYGTPLAICEGLKLGGSPSLLSDFEGGKIWVQPNVFHNES